MNNTSSTESTSRGDGAGSPVNSTRSRSRPSTGPSCAMPQAPSSPHGSSVSHPAAAISRSMEWRYTSWWTNTTTSWLARRAPWFSAAPAVVNACSVLSTGRYSTSKGPSYAEMDASRHSFRTRASLKTQTMDRPRACGSRPAMSIPPLPPGVRQFLTDHGVRPWSSGASPAKLVATLDLARAPAPLMCSTPRVTRLRK